MRPILLLCILTLCNSLFAQQNLPIRSFRASDSLPIPVSLRIDTLGMGAVTDASGIGTLTIPINGVFNLQASSVGYRTVSIPLVIPYIIDTLYIALEAEEEELEEVIIRSTRTSRTIATVPTRVETIEEEEIDEKMNMRPGNVRMILHESTGIQVQQTSATTGNSSVRIQGLDGRYTQLLKDGFPNFGNFSSGLSLLEIPPLDLQQVEIIKGPASTLYGGGAIAGVINFISKAPGEGSKYNFILNASNVGQFNMGGFSSGRKEKIGYTLLAAYNRQKEYDVDEDDFSELPQASDFTIHPKLFFYPSANTTIIFGNSYTKGERTGGDMQVIRFGETPAHRYFEKNKTHRNISTLDWETILPGKNRLVVKQSFSIFNRSLEIDDDYFEGRDKTAYTDISFIGKPSTSQLVLGLNLNYNKFNHMIGGNLSSNTTALGAYGQYTKDLSEKVILESGFRIERMSFSNPYYSIREWFFLPRVSVLVKFNESWSSRIGGGLGYKPPTPFTEETERRQYFNIPPVLDNRSEKSGGVTADISYRSNWGGDLSFSLNQMFFYTEINHPIVLQEFGGFLQFRNMESPVRSFGFETNLRFVYKDNFKAFLGYTYTDARASYLSGNNFLPLVPKHKLNSALIYEKEGVIKLGLEGYFTGKQFLSSGEIVPSFSIFGFLAEKIFTNYSLFINFENFTDTRQSKYKPVANGSHQSPTFDEIWMNTEGFIINGGIKIRF